MDNKKYDLVVIGGGVLGVFSAYHALRMGKTVALIERHKRSRGATVRNFGQVVPSGLSMAWRRHGRKSLEIYRELQSITDMTIRSEGTVYLASDPDELLLLEEMFQLDRGMDYASEMLSAEQARSRYPGLRKPYCHGAIYYPEELSCDPRQMIHRVIDLLVEQYGLAFFPGTVAIDLAIDHDETCRVTSNRRAIFLADQVLICNGVEYQMLLPELYENEEIECSKLQMMVTKPQKQLRLRGNILSGLSIRRYESFRECPSYEVVKARGTQDERVAAWGVHILFKQADNGQVIIGDSHHYAPVPEQDDLDFDIHQDVNNFILAQAREIFDLEHWDLDSTWYGVYSQCRNQDVLLKTIEKRVHIINAIGGKGMTAGPGFTYYQMQKIFGND